MTNALQVLLLVQTINIYDYINSLNILLIYSSVLITYVVVTFTTSQILKPFTVFYKFIILFSKIYVDLKSYYFLSYFTLIRLSEEILFSII